MNAKVLVSNCFTGVKNVLWPDSIKPRLLVFEVTRRCNSRCLHCDIWKQKPSVDLSVEQIRMIVSDGLFDDLEKVILTGGEPTTRKDLFEVIKVFYERNSEIEVWLSTNGLKPDFVEDLVFSCQKLGVKLGVGVSLDGVSEKHDFIRGVKGNFGLAAETINRVLGLGAVPLVGFTLSSLTENNFGDVDNFCRSLNVPLLIQRFDSSDFYSTNSEINELSLEFLNKNDVLYDYWKNDKKWICYALHSFFVLHCNGDVSGCLKKYGDVVGSMVCESPGVVWARLDEKRSQIRCCRGCLNDWAFRESLKTRFFPLLRYAVKKRFD